jgi:hypothetical protein
MFTGFGMRRNKSEKPSGSLKSNWIRWCRNLVLPSDPLRKTGYFFLKEIKYDKQTATATTAKATTDFIQTSRIDFAICNTMEKF